MKETKKKKRFPISHELLKKRFQDCLVIPRVRTESNG